MRKTIVLSGQNWSNPRQKFNVKLRIQNSQESTSHELVLKMSSPNDDDVTKEHPHYASLQGTADRPNDLDHL